ncbi:MAG TPA: glycosyltransferase [Crinalium sp.]|jgi:glycosyltransferase involved in cell wall biosynthesis
MTIRVSVVVPTCDRSALLNRCLQALVTQEFDPTEYEIVIADDAASAATRQLVEDWASRTDRLPVLRYIPVTGSHGPAAARNIGWRSAVGEIIAFTDDDCIPQSEWLRQGMAAFKPGITGVSGQLKIPLPPDPTDYERNAAELEKAEFATANCFYRRDAIAKINGFDERFTAPWREDSDLFFTLLKQGGCFVSAPDAIVVHPIRPAPWGVSLLQQPKSYFNALLYKKHPVLYREKLPPVTPWHYYGIVGALLLAIAAAAMGHEWGAIAALLGWVILTIQFCLQRLQHTSHSLNHVVEMALTSILIPPVSLFWRVAGAIRFRVFFL